MIFGKEIRLQRGKFKLTKYAPTGLDDAATLVSEVKIAQDKPNSPNRLPFQVEITGMGQPDRFAGFKISTIFLPDETKRLQIFRGNWEDKHLIPYFENKGIETVLKVMEQNLFVINMSGKLTIQDLSLDVYGSNEFALARLSFGLFKLIQSDVRQLSEKKVLAMFPRV